MTRRQRVLFFGEAVSLAHVVRPIALSRMLDSSEYEVFRAWDPRYHHIADPPDHPLWTIPARQFSSALHRGTPIYREEDLSRYVTDDLAAIERFNPDVVVGDFRLSLGVSARLAGVRYLNIANAYWSPHATVHAPVPDGMLTGIAGVRLGQRLFNLGSSAVAAWHTRPFQRLNRRYGLPPIVGDIRAVYTQGDETLYADIKEIVPMADLPASHRFLGPIPWSPQVELPDWWRTLPADEPVVYVALGSSGRGDLLPVILAALSRLPVTVVAATAGAPLPGRVPANARITDLLPGDRVAARASVVIGNGGSPTTYQGLTAGKPVIGVCGNLDQYLNMNLVEQAGAGRLLRSGRLSEAVVRQAVTQALNDDEMRRRAEDLSRVITRYRTAERFLSGVAAKMPA